MGSPTTWITPPEFDLGYDYIDVYDNGMHLQAWLTLPNGATLEAQFVALPDEETPGRFDFEYDSFMRSHVVYQMARDDVGAGTHYVRVKGKHYLYTLTCWAAPAPVYRKE